jgi:phosphoenolpyruvate-protein kinase (PTS system EI component)
VGELSVAPQSVPAVKRVVRELEMLDCADLAARALEAVDAAAVRDLVVGAAVPTQRAATA